MPISPDGDHLAEIRELNHLFLAFLQSRARAGEDCLGLKKATVAALLEASPECLTTLATFPRALFHLELNTARSFRGMDPDIGGREPASYVLRLTILHCAWSMSRHSPYAARLLFGLEEADLCVLRSATLSELQQLSQSDKVVACAFPESDRFWQKLLTETRPELRRQLLLIGLQPRLHLGVSPPRSFGRFATA